MRNALNVEFGEQMGFSELYEWGEDNPTDYINQNKELLSEQNFDNFINYNGKLVQFSEQFPQSVIRARSIKNIVGISTINSGYTVSNPKQWPFKYIINEYGDLYLNRKDIAEGKKVYDSINEMPFIQTCKKTIVAPLENPDYDKTQEYNQRKNRGEWCNVIILGKAIIEDNGKCEAGKYCTLYKGNDKNLYGTVEPADENDEFKLYVLQRLSEHTIVVFFSPKI